MSNIARMSSELGYSPRLHFLGAPEAEPGTEGFDTEVAHGSGLAMVSVMFRALWRREPVVMTGVWHAPFFVGGAVSMVAPSATYFLVPTNSLMPWDWKKHAAKKRLLRPVVGALVRRFGSVVVASTGELEQSEPALGRRGTVIPHSVRVLPPSLERAGDRAPVAFLGRVAVQKNIELLIDACAQSERSTDLVVIGDGDDEYVADLQIHAESLGVNLRVTGWLDPQQIADELAKSRVVAVTSYAENFCHAAAEAAVAGTPVVVVDRIASATDLAEHPLISAVSADAGSLAAALDSAGERATASLGSRSELFYDANWSAAAFASRWRQLLQHSVKQSSL